MDIGRVVIDFERREIALRVRLLCGPPADLRRRPQRSQERTYFCSLELTQRVRTASMTRVISRCNLRVTGRIRVETAEGPPLSRRSNIHNVMLIPRWFGLTPRRVAGCAGGARVWHG